MTAFLPSGDYLLTALHAVSTARHAARRADRSGKYADAACLSAQLSARSCAGHEKGQRLSRDALREQLDSAGYRHVDQVMEHGEYATRGALLDLFPMGSELPYRLDFFDDEIDSLRLFDTDTQRTLEEVDAINLLPAHEFPTDKTAIELFRSQWRDTFEVKRDAEHIYQQVSKGTLPTGLNTGSRCFSASRCRRCSATSPPIRY